MQKKRKARKEKVRKEGWKEEGLHFKKKRRKSKKEAINFFLRWKNIEAFFTCSCHTRKDIFKFKQNRTFVHTNIRFFYFGRISEKRALVRFLIEGQRNEENDLVLKSTVIHFFFPVPYLQLFHCFGFLDSYLCYEKIWSSLPKFASFGYELNFFLGSFNLEYDSLKQGWLIF